MFKCLAVLFLLILNFQTQIFASCGGTALTWNSTGNRNWSTATNWNPNNIPDSASEDVVIINTGVNSRVNVNSTVGCVDVQSGTLAGTSALTLTVTGDYFNAPFQNTLNFTNSAFVIDMAGTTPQQFTALDNIRDLRLSNNSEVTLNGEFIIVSDLIFNSTGKTYVTGTITQNTKGNTTTIPAGHTLVLKSGSTFYFRGNLVVDGVLKIEAGAFLKMYRNKSLTINSGGVIQIIGASGNPAKITSEASSLYFNFIMNGTMIANNFQILRPSTAGIQLNGTASQLDNGEIRGMNTNGYAITLGANANIPSTINTIGFFNDDDRGNVRNFNASSYNKTATTISDYSGDVAGATKENDPNAKINWLTPATTQISIINDAESGEPTTTLNPSIETTFAEFAFTLTQADVATDITQIDLTMTGTASISDLEYVTAYLDTNGNCNYNATDTLIGNLNFSGYPPKAVINLNPGEITTANPTQQACLIIRAKSSANPTDQKTVKFGIMSATDITNSQGYEISSTSGTPIETGTSTIRNRNYASWDGGTNTLWSTTTNWRNDVIPTSVLDCQIGAALNNAQIDTTPVACSNATLQTNGVINWNNTSNIFEIYSALNVQPSFSFLNSTSGVISFKGSNNQTLSLESSFPGSIILDNAGASGSNMLTITTNSTVEGNFTCIQGELSIPAGITFSVKGNITVNSGCTMSVEAGGTLALGNNSTLLINSGGRLNLVGTSSLNSNIRGINSSDGIMINVLGEIAAKYYAISNLKSTGLTINSSASIDTTNNLSNGSFLYPAASGTTLLTLSKLIPSNILDAMVFNSNGSSATSITNIDTTNASSATLTISSYSGDLAGPSFDIDPTYFIDWQGQTNTLDLDLIQNAPTTVVVGNVYKMATFSIKQTLAGASYDPTDITKIVLTQTGTGVATDITSTSLYLDSDCDGTNGVNLGTTTFSGNPAKATFNITAGVYTINSDISNPPANCFYVEYNIASGATNNSTLGVKITSAADILNSENYSFSSTKAPPINSTNAVIDAPTTTIWTGSTNTSWTTATNWTSGVPDQNKTCQIPNTANNPVISASASCKNVDITSGILNIGVSGNLSVYGNFTNTGTLIQTGVLTIADGGVNLSHSLNSTTTLSNLSIAKTGGGIININDTELIVNQLNITGNSFRVEVNSGKKLVLPNGVTIPSGEIRASSSGTIEIGANQTITVSGGTFALLGVNDVFPQGVNSKGRVTTIGGTGVWNFNATSGNLNLNGFYLDRLSSNGLVIGGTTNILNLSGGQFTNLPTNYSSVKAIQINTTGTIPASSTNIAWNWGAFNTFTSNAGTPTTTDSYQLISSSGCGSKSIDFSGWSGDWFESTSTFDVSTKISATNCNITMSNAASSVSLKSLVAEGFSNAIKISWETNTEINHMGFNVYRTDAFGSTFQQINPILLKNINNAGNKKGEYHFSDYDVASGEVHYYYIEDIDLAGISKLHGPVFAKVDSTLASAPAPGAGDNPNDGDDGDTSNPYPVPNPSYQNLGNGVVITKQTSSALQIEITPEAANFSTSTWDNSYQDVQVTGYSKLAKENFPELPSRVILIDVNEFATTAEILDQEITQSSLGAHLVTPAPHYTLVDNRLEASFSPDSQAYTSSELYPASFFSVQTNLIKDGDKKLLKIVINPLLFKASTQEINSLTKLVLDIGLDGNDWEAQPSSDRNRGVINTPNTIKVGVNKQGIYEVSYTQLESSNVHTPLEDAQISNLRAYYLDQEIPIEIISTNSLFDSNDKIRFIIPETLHKMEYVTLTNIDILDKANSPLRISSIDAQINNTGLQESASTKSILLEDNLVFVDGESLGDDKDHFFWQHLQNYSGYEKFTQNFTLNDIDLNSPINTKITFRLKGAPGYYGSFFDHHLKLVVNGTEISDVIITDNERHDTSFEVPNELLTSGVNSLELEVLGTYAVSGDYDRVYINNFQVEYITNNQAQNNKHIIYSEQIGENQLISNFSSNQISLYEYKAWDEVQKLEQTTISTKDTGLTYQVEYFLDEELAENSDGKYIYAYEESSFETAISLSINRGLTKAISDYKKTDIIILADKTLQDSTTKFIAHRKGQGLSVAKFTPEEIYNEYSFGRPDPKAINELVKNLQARFLIILGDGSTDPLNYNINGDPDEELSSLQKQTIPSILATGRFMDFLSDNLISKVQQKFTVSIGRIPSNSPLIISNYFDKVISYENGEKQPSNLKKLSFIADEDQGYYENFSKKIESFANITSSFSSNLVKRSDYASKEETRAQILTEFNSNNYMITMMGHGASDRFADGIFLNSHAQELSNQTLPIVTTWNCETAAYFYPNNTETSLGENLIFNQYNGAIAFIGPVTQTTPTAQFNFASTFYTTFEAELRKNYSGQRLGDILRISQNSLSQSSYDQDIILATQILGDPSLMIPKQMFKANNGTKNTGVKAGGCSANASSGNNAPWYYGLFEFLFCLVMIRFCRQCAKNGFKI